MLFNPAVIALSAVWGQVDSVPALLVLSSLLLLFTGRQSLQRELGAFLLFAGAVAMKPQTGFVLPVMLYALYRRYLHRRRAGDLVDGILAVAVIGAVSFAAWAISGLPFDLGPRGLVHLYNQSGSLRPVTSANAFNLWGLLGFWRQDSTAPYAFGGGPLPVVGTHAAQLGVIAFVVLVAYVLWQSHRAIEHGVHEGRVLTVAAAVSGLLAYALLTRMHERYMFTSLVCFAPLLFVRQLRLTYAVLSGLFLLNLWYAFAFFNSRTSAEDLRFNPLFDWIFGGPSVDSWQNKLYSLAVAAVAVVVAFLGVRWVQDLRAPGEPVTIEAHRRPALEPRQPSARPQVPVPVPGGRLARRMPHAVVALSCLFGLVILRGELKPAQYLNDSAFHLQMVRWAGDRIREGNVPLDGWFPDLSLGSSFFHHYQSLPHTLTAVAAYVTGMGDHHLYLWITYLLLALWPIAIYWSARLLGWSPWVGAAAAAVSPLVASQPLYGYEQASYVWQGWGLYSQLWAMWLLPITWGLTWRAVSHGRQITAAAVALALTIACHFITGYLAVLTVGVWVLVFAGSSFLRRAGRAAIVVVASLLIASWVIVPLVGDTKWTTQTEFYIGSFYRDSYGAHKVLRWLFDGTTFDFGRSVPVISLLVLTGAIVCIVRARRDPRARALLGAFVLSLLLFFGRPTWGRLLDVMPGMGDIQIHRFVMGVQLAGIFLAGIGLAWLLRLGYTLISRSASPRYVPALGVGLVALAIAALTPAWTERIHYNERGAAAIRYQHGVDQVDGRAIERFASIVKKNGDGRVYAGLRSNWGANYRVGSVHTYAYLADLDVDAIGFTFRTIPSLSNDPEALFDEAKPSNYEMFDIRYLILPPDRKPSVPATQIASSRYHRLYRVNTTGYWQVVDRAAAIPEDRKHMWSSTADFMRSDLASRNIYPGVAFGGEPGPAPTFSGASPPPGPPGVVVTQSQQLQDGEASATVRANRPAVALLKATYDPRWRATVDGKRVMPVMMAPSLVGVDVPPGTHRVELRYEPYDKYPVLLGVGVLTLLGLIAYPRRERLRAAFVARRAQAPSPGAPPPPSE